MNFESDQSKETTAKKVSICIKGWDFFIVFASWCMTPCVGEKFTAKRGWLLLDCVLRGDFRGYFLPSVVLSLFVASQFLRQTWYIRLAILGPLVIPVVATFFSPYVRDQTWLLVQCEPFIVVSLVWVWLGTKP